MGTTCLGEFTTKTGGHMNYTAPAVTDLGSLSELTLQGSPTKNGPVIDGQNGNNNGMSGSIKR